LSIIGLPLALPNLFALAPDVLYDLDTRTVVLLSVTLGLLFVAFLVGQFLRRQPDTTVNMAVVNTFNARIRAWWLMCAILVAAFLLPGTWATVTLFGLISFWALREFITLTPTRLGDHRALFWVFFLITPLQFVLVGMDCYGLFSIGIPIVGLLFVPARIALAGDFKRFLERTAKIQAGLLICVYALSFAPALLHLTQWKDWDGSTAGLLFYFLLISQMGDVFQYVWDKMLGKRVVAPAINATKTWEGHFGGMASTAVLGAGLWWVTPFNIWQSACMSLVIGVMGFAGSLTMSAIKRDRGVKDYGTLIEGHAGVLDRIDSICFAAPIFYILTRLLFTTQGL
jgi:phosphatidate cytidylyltransferase